MAAGWDGRTRGTHWMQRALVGIIRAVGVRPIYWVMHLWLVWYCLVRGSERRSSYQFHRIRGRLSRELLPNNHHRIFYIQILSDRPHRRTVLL